MKKKFCRTVSPAPLLNRPDFSKLFGGHPQGVVLDENGLLFPLETIALEGVYVIIEILEHHLGASVNENTIIWVGTFKDTIQKSGVMPSS